MNPPFPHGHLHCTDFLFTHLFVQPFIPTKMSSFSLLLALIVFIPFPSHIHPCFRPFIVFLKYFPYSLIFCSLYLSIFSIVCLDFLVSSCPPFPYSVLCPFHSFSIPYSISSCPKELLNFPSHCWTDLCIGKHH